MSNYFSIFPKATYDISGNTVTKEATDILRRFIVRLVVDKRVTEIYQYNIKDGDRPDIIAHKYYGSSDYDWVIMMLNNIYDVNYDWPLSQQNFIKFLISKYGSIALAKSGVHHYEQIIQQESWNALGTHIPEIVVTVDLATYTALIATDRKSISSYDYELALNDSKRIINILDVKYLDKIVDKAAAVFANA